MAIFDTLKKTGLPCAYSHFKNRQQPPYLVYIGSGQTIMRADDTHYWSENTYQVEYYFVEKNEAAEAAVEAIMLGDGFQFTKSDDVFIEDEGVFVIYYYLN